MEDSSTFERLVSNMSDGERKDLFERIQNSKNLSSAPLVEAEDQDQVNFQAEYQKLNFFQRIFLFLVAVFTGRKTDDLVENHLLKKIQEKIEKKHYGLVDFTRKQLLNKFKAELTTLAQQIISIQAPFDRALGKNKGAFFAFLASIELGDVQNQLQEATDPEEIFEHGQFGDLAQVRGEMEARFNKIIKDVSDEDRSRIYKQVLSIHYFNELANFNFKDFIDRFDDLGSGGTGVIHFSMAKKFLLKLNDLLASASYPPTSRSVKTAFLFDQHDEEAHPDLIGNEDLEDSLARAENAFNAIRNFNKAVPMTNIIRCILKKYNYSPRRVPGGQDWFAFFRSYWEKQLDKRYRDFFRKRKMGDYQDKIKVYLGVKSLPFYDYYNPQYNYFGLTLTYSFTMTLFKGFYEIIFAKKLARSLKILLINGIFFKKENRSNYTDSFNRLNELHKHCLQLDAALAPDGEFGEKLERIQQEPGADNIRKNKGEVIFNNITKRAQKILLAVLEDLTMISNILNGVLYGEIGGKFDTISNLKSIGGRENSDIVSSWRLSLNLFQKILELFKEIFNIEKRD